MVKLLIADRDHNERTGIGWLVNSYAIPFDRVVMAGTIPEVFQIIESEMPDVICIELDMIPREVWDSFKERIKQYKQTIIVMTAEATFERAMQGIELHAHDLWIKPHSPDSIRRVLARCCKAASSAQQDTEIEEGAIPPALSYHSLFLPQKQAADDCWLLLLQLEKTEQQPRLLSFLQDYPFHHAPVLLPLSDMIVSIFTREPRHSLFTMKKIGNRLLQEWEEKFAEPLSLVLYDTKDKSLALQQKYQYARQALEIRFFKGYRQVSIIEDKVDWQIIDPFLTPAEQREWIGMLGDGDRERLKLWMYKEFLNKEEPYPEPGLLRTRLTSILAQVRRFMKSYCLDQGRLEERYHRVFETILYNPILYRIVQEFLLFLYEMLDMAKEYREDARIDIIEQALRYIEENYTNPNLRLEDVADYVARSPAYFSSLFMKRQGHSFRQLVTTIRIKEAQRLLLDTKLSVQEVAERAGFINANYFSKIFKEKTGLTPRMFRNRKKM
ncbi:helix-turn-helix domain-containing protein [Aneurinibacillus sp. UBA3580]|jgi:YesN/AraC family two-component response regulator|uniref:helix-turn-helix domain-containing protein n=1 Tax=Aneurinibacillus sp. UBA3580 TaxID=1946041 RepID=UPI00257BA767|nr:helix-turn-helix domain-containing protein [Aneurinibacillus sp. UBA3580]